MTDNMQVSKNARKHLRGWQKSARRINDVDEEEPE